jgi:hypothetical protein
VNLEQLLEKTERDILLRRLAGKNSNPKTNSKEPQAMTASAIEVADILLATNSTEFKELMSQSKMRGQEGLRGEAEVDSLASQMHQQSLRNTSLDKINKIGVSDMSLDELDDLVADIVAGKRDFVQEAKEDEEEDEEVE